MIPIYRTRDGIRKVSKNEEIFAECLRLLNVKKQPIGIFPEGNHNLRYTLRPLRKGITRIAFDAAEQSENPDELFIVPCGYTYSAYTQFRSNLLVNMGKPIPVKPFYNLWKESQGDAIKDLLDEIRKGLTEVMIHINPDHYGEVYQTWQENKPYHPNLHQEFLLDKKMIREIEAGTFKKETKKSGSAAKFLYTLLGFPLFLLGLINNIVVWAVITLMVKKLVTDVHFISPIRCYGGMVVVPLIYLIQGLILNLFVPYWWWTILYLGMILILGQFAGDYYNQVFRTSGSEMKIPDPVE